MRETLESHRNLWENKPVLREIYCDFYERIKKYASPGRSLEIGGGSGNLKGYLPEVISTDIIHSPWLDVTANAEHLPFKDNLFSNIVGVDVLHHIPTPRNFFSEADRTLKTGGKIILVEPAITAISWFFYHFFHPEAVRLGADPFGSRPLSNRNDPFDANQAIPSLIFVWNRKKFSNIFPQLRIVDVQHFSMIAYPLSGGVRSWSLIPTSLTPSILKLEDRFLKYLSPMAGFRLLIIFQKERKNSESPPVC